LTTLNSSIIFDAVNIVCGNDKNKEIFNGEGKMTENNTTGTMRNFK